MPTSLFSFPKPTESDRPHCESCCTSPSILSPERRTTGGRATGEGGMRRKGRESGSKEECEIEGLAEREKESSFVIRRLELQKKVN